MNIFGKLWASLNRIIAAANALADTLEEANGNVRTNLALDAPAEKALPAPPPDALPEPRKKGSKG